MQQKTRRLIVAFIIYFLVSSVLWAVTAFFGLAVDWTILAFVLHISGIKIRYAFILGIIALVCAAGGIIAGISLALSSAEKHLRKQDLQE